MQEFIRAQRQENDTKKSCQDCQRTSAFTARSLARSRSFDLVCHRSLPCDSCVAQRNRTLALKNGFQALVNDRDGTEFGQHLPVAMHFRIGLRFGAHLGRGPVAHVQQAIGTRRIAPQRIAANIPWRASGYRAHAASPATLLPCPAEPPEQPRTRFRQPFARPFMRMSLTGYPAIISRRKLVAPAL